jgi:F0F1-type ATP synthase assembly protein I
MVDQSRSVAAAVSLLAELVGGLLVGLGLLTAPGGAA